MSMAPCGNLGPTSGSLLLSRDVRGTKRKLYNNQRNSDFLEESLLAPLPPQKMTVEDWELFGLQGLKII